MLLFAYFAEVSQAVKKYPSPRLTVNVIHYNNTLWVILQVLKNSSALTFTTKAPHLFYYTNCYKFNKSIFN